LGTAPVGYGREPGRDTSFPCGLLLVVVNVRRGVLALNHRVALAILVGVGLAAAAANAVVFLVPYSLLEYYEEPLLDIGKISGRTRVAGEAFFAGFVGLFLLYLMALWASARLGGTRPVAVALAGSLLQFIVLSFVYPIGAIDVFDYLLSPRVWILHDANPFVVAPAVFPDDPFIPYAAYAGLAFSYGPFWLFLSTPVTLLAGDELLLGLFGLKALMGLGLLASLVLVAAILPPERRALAVVLLGWNPLVLFEFSANAHNDAWVVAFLLLGVFFARRGGLVGSMLALAASGLVKFAAFPLMLVFLAAEAAHRRFRRVLIAGAAACVLVLASYAPFLGDGDVLTALKQRQELFTTSLPTLVFLWLEPGVADAPSLAARGALVLFALIVGTVALVVFVRKIDPVRGSFEVLFFYFVLAVVWFQPWYVTWLVALAAVLPSGAVAVRAILYSWTATFAYPLFYFIWTWTGASPEKINAWAVLSIHGPPAVLTLVLAGWWLVNRRRRAAREPGEPETAPA
jgi:hypothetical protein